MVTNTKAREASVWTERMSCRRRALPARPALVNGVVVAKHASGMTPNNFSGISAFRYHVVVAWVRTLRRRSQRSTLTWERMQVHLERYLPKARVLHPWPEARFRVKHSRWEQGRVSSARRDLCGGGQQ